MVATLKEPNINTDWRQKFWGQMPFRIPHTALPRLFVPDLKRPCSGTEAQFFLYSIVPPFNNLWHPLQQLWSTLSKDLSPAWQDEAHQTTELWWNTSSSSFNGYKMRTHLATSFAVTHLYKKGQLLLIQNSWRHLYEREKWVKSLSWTDRSQLWILFSQDESFSHATTLENTFVGGFCKHLALAPLCSS